MAKGMNMGILSLLGVVVFVLSGIAAFFIYLAKRSSMAGASVVAPGKLSQTTK
jgi:maltodextrin utilization protein YvdJ